MPCAHLAATTPHLGTPPIPLCAARHSHEDVQHRGTSENGQGKPGTEVQGSWHQGTHLSPRPGSDPEPAPEPLVHPE